MNKTEKKEYDRIRYINKKERINVLNKTWRLANKEKSIATQKVWNEKNINKIKEINKRCRNKYKLKNKERKRKWNLENRDRVRENARMRYQKNSLKIKERSKQYRKDNPDKVRSWNAGRRASIANASPSWLDKKLKKQILSFYVQSDKLTKDTGVEHHVDHIIPLVNPKVCGLHVPWNLQVITKESNLKKSNKLRLL